MPTANAVMAIGTATVDADCSVISVGTTSAPSATSAMLAGADSVAGVSGVGSDIIKSYVLFNSF
jgi:hypothetical protein